MSFEEWVVEVARVLGCEPQKLIDHDQSSFYDSWHIPGLRALQTIYSTNASPQEAADLIRYGGV